MYLCSRTTSTNPVMIIVCHTVCVWWCLINDQLHCDPILKVICQALLAQFSQRHVGCREGTDVVLRCSVTGGKKEGRGEGGLWRRIKNRPQVLLVEESKPLSAVMVKIPLIEWDDITSHAEEGGGVIMVISKLFWLVSTFFFFLNDFHEGCERVGI